MARKARKSKGGRADGKKVRYAVVGQGYISQVAVLPAFEHASENSELAALVSDDADKLDKLSRKYGVDTTATYEDYDALCQSGKVDAVYIALPNSMHREYTERAARAGVHVLCEKPMALSESDCRAMIDACDEAGVKLMVAYRLHYERANLECVEALRSGKVGEPRFFVSGFSTPVEDEDNIRLKKDLGGGPLWDLGIYCINAARYLFGAEPTEVAGMTAAGADPRFAEVEESFSALLRFPGERLASFTCSFGGGDVAAYRVVGSKGSIQLDGAYEYAVPMTMTVNVGEGRHRKSFHPRDQFAPELIAFSRCVLDGNDPEPSGWEGLADVRVIRALIRSAEKRQWIELAPFTKEERPDLSQEIHRPAVKEPRLVNVQPPSEG